MLAQQLVNGLVAGSTYALFALGFTLMFGVLRVINLTYGFVFSAGALMALALVRQFSAPVALALPLAALASGLLAVALDEAIVLPLWRAGAPELSSLMATLGATLALTTLATAYVGADIQRFPAAAVSAAAYEFGSVRVSATQLLVVAASLIALAGLLALMHGGRLGLAIRAVAENPTAARLMGVDPAKILRLASFASGALAGAAGVLIGLNNNAIQPYLGEAMMLKGFAVIILGGLGDLRGALVAGLVIGMLEALTAGYVASAWKDAVGFALLVLTLWLRPTGLFGSPAARRA